MAKHNNSILKINPYLPIIVLPENKVKLFIDWFNTDIRFLKEVPKVFEKGYINIKYDLLKIDITHLNKLFTSLAKTMNTTYRKVETMYKQYISNFSDVMCYFEFKTDNAISFVLYGQDKQKISEINIEVGDSNDTDSNSIINSAISDNILDGFKIEDNNNPDLCTEYIQNKYNYFFMCLCVTCIWYMATTTNSTKYEYKNRKYKDDKQNMIEKDVINIKEYKQMSTPIYNLKNIKVKTVDRLVTRRKGWTYSHSFQVHGHYRHYKNGKTIFIQSYIKGDKPFKRQTIIINPCE